MRLTSGIKKIMTLTIAIFSIGIISLVTSSSLRAQFIGISDIFLKEIADNTLGTLNAVNNLPELLIPLTAMAKAWTDPDTSTNTTSLQGILPNIVSDTIQNMSAQNGLQPKLLNDFFGDPSKEAPLMPYANDMTYQTLIGYPYYSTDPRKNNKNNPDSAYNYIKNAAGLNLLLEPPGNNWNGPIKEQRRYASYFLTLTSVQTFDAYTLSSLYANYKNGADLNKQQLDLYSLANNTKPWFTEIASENIGSVLRQILMFSSETYIVLTQLLETEKQLLMAQTMNNSVVVLLAQVSLHNDMALYGKATGTTPST
jgi:hypothetical protein